MADVGVIVVAGGSGTRLGAPVPKAYVELAGMTLLRRSLGRIAEARPRHVVIVAPAGALGQAYDEAAGLGLDLSVVPGGAERRDSVAAGLGALPDGIPVVLVHDAARCLTPATLFRDVAAAVLQRVSAVVPGLPVPDTIKVVRDDGTVEATPPRAALRAIQTPQGFPRELLERAHAETPPDAVVTDDAGMVEALGEGVVVIPGHPLAAKVTTPADLRWAAAALEEA